MKIKNKNLQSVLDAALLVLIAFLPTISAVIILRNEPKKAEPIRKTEIIVKSDTIIINHKNQ